MRLPGTETNLLSPVEPGHCRANRVVSSGSTGFTQRRPCPAAGLHLIFVTGTFFLLNDEGLRLPKGATLRLPSPDPDTGVYPFPGASYCIEDDGTVSDSELP